MELGVAALVKPQPSEKELAVVGGQDDGTVSRLSGPIDHKNVAGADARINHGVSIRFDEEGGEGTANQQIIRSRAFGKPVTDAESLTSDVSKHMADACISLRRQKSVAFEVGVIFHTNFFRDDRLQYSAAPVIRLPSGSSDTLLLTRVAVNLVKRFYRKGYAYQKAGITLSGIQPEIEDSLPTSLFDFGPSPPEKRRRALMTTLDGLTRIYGRGVVRTGSAALTSGWEARHEKLSQRWLTNGSDILRVHRFHTGACVRKRK